jgi:hypothetical protein
MLSKAVVLETGWMTGRKTRERRNTLWSTLWFGFTSSFLPAECPQQAERADGRTLAWLPLLAECSALFPRHIHPAASNLNQELRNS